MTKVYVVAGYDRAGDAVEISVHRDPTSAAVELARIVDERSAVPGDLYPCRLHVRTRDPRAVVPPPAPVAEVVVKPFLIPATPAPSALKR